MSPRVSSPARAAAYAAAALAVLYAAVSLYWALGGQALLATVRGSVAELARWGVALGLAVWLRRREPGDRGPAAD